MKLGKHFTLCQNDPGKLQLFCSTNIESAWWSIIIEFSFLTKKEHKIHTERLNILAIFFPIKHAHSDKSCRTDKILSRATVTLRQIIMSIYFRELSTFWVQICNATDKLLSSRKAIAKRTAPSTGQRFLLTAGSRYPTLTTEPDISSRLSITG